MNRWILFCGCLLSSLFLEAQGDSLLRFRKKLSMKGDDFAVDNLGNIYLLTSGNLLKKYNQQGDSAGIFNDVRRYGTLYKMDVTNPLKILLYYKNFATLVMLDRFLNRINTIDLRKAGIFQARAVALSYDNQVWVFDEQAGKLKKIGEDGRLLSESIEFRQLFDEVPSPETIIDRDGFVYLYDPRSGVYVFDYYGAFKTRLPIEGLQDLQVVNQTIIGRKEGRIISYQLGTLTLRELVLPLQWSNAAQVRILPQGVYLLQEDGISFYSFN